MDKRGSQIHQPYNVIRNILKSVDVLVFLQMIQMNLLKTLKQVRVICRSVLHLC